MAGFCCREEDVAFSAATSDYRTDSENPWLISMGWVATPLIYPL